MDALSISAASGFRSRLETLELLANNLANAATGGYKNDRESYSLYIAPEAEDGSGEGKPATLPVIGKQWIDFSQGVLQPTGNPLDFALAGKGFFTVNGPSGPLYTRNGSFRMAVDGSLTTAEGYAVRLLGGGTLQAQPGKALDLAPDGTVSQEGQNLGQLEIVDFPDPAALVKMGGNYFRPADPAVKPAPAAKIELHQGQVESSNVVVAESAVRLVEVMRQFEMMQKAIALGAEMNRRAIEEVARVG